LVTILREKDSMSDTLKKQINDLKDDLRKKSTEVESAIKRVTDEEREK
jgi:hypothetical protein